MKHTSQNIHPEHTHSQFTRRGWLQTAGVLAGAAWLTPVSRVLAQQAENQEKGATAKSVILLWMAGGPSQLETFDPHPGKEISGETKAIATAVPGIQLAQGYERLAEEMASISLIRSLTSKEGDHERGTYNLKTGYRPDPTLVHPSLGAVICHELPDDLKIAGKRIHTDIPRHVSILPNQWSGRGGYLGDQFDAFKIFDPVGSIPDVTNGIPIERAKQRMEGLDVVEKAFARGRLRDISRTMHRETVANARTMMTSEQLDAFDVRKEPQAVQDAFGDTPFGRGCLAARRLIEVGVRCVEVTLDGWDTHADNFNGCKQQASVLDPAFAALIRDLRERKLLEHTVVVCVGEFGRTPRINGVGGRDHWPNNFCAALAGGGLRAGLAIGESDPEGGKTVAQPIQVADLHATILKTLGIAYSDERITPIQRPLKLSEGQPIAALL